MTAPTELQQRLGSEVLDVTWDALVPHFARGALVYVNPTLPLVKAAMAVGLDAADDVRAWMADGTMHPVTDAQAKAWAGPPMQRFRFLIVQPFVLAQPIEPEAEAENQGE